MTTELPSALSPTRDTARRIATHVLGRRRFEVTGRFGLRAAPGGIATPAFGETPEVLRISGGSLVHEQGGSARVTDIHGSSLRRLAAFAGTDLAAPFSVGRDTVEVGDADEPLTFDVPSMRLLAGWYGFAWTVLDTIASTMSAPTEVATIQLWPEHFDAATTVRTSSGVGVNLGFSPGDDHEDEPYVYVGPHDGARGGDPAFWNVPFGALRRATEITAAADSFAAATDFLRTGLRHAGSPSDAPPGPTSGV